MKLKEIKLAGLAVFTGMCVLFAGGCASGKPSGQSGAESGTDEDGTKDGGEAEGTDGTEDMEQAEEIKRLFPNADGAWVGDVMAQADENGIYLNYLYETDSNGVAYHPIHRFFTSDLCSYQDQGEILPFGTELESPDLAVGTGSFMQDQDGKYHFFYTGHNDKAADLGIAKECVMHAVSDDNTSWEKVPEDTFYAPEGYSNDDFRDPLVFWDDGVSGYRMLIGAKEQEGSDVLELTSSARKPGQEKEGSVILEFTSSDLKSWELKGTFYGQEDLYYMECPDLFQMGGWYYLTFSWNNVTYYRMAKSADGPWETPEIDTFDGRAFYAAKTVEYQGKRYLFGFVDRKKNGNDNFEYTWAGSVCPYELTQGEDGTLGVKMPSQYEENYFVEESPLGTSQTAGDVKEDGKSVSLKAEGEMAYAVYDVLPESMMLSCKVKVLGSEAKVGFLMGIEEEAGKSYPLVLDFEHGSIVYEGYQENLATEASVRNEQAFGFEEGKEYEIKMVVENEVVVLYVNGERALSNRIYHAVDNKWGIFAQNAEVEFSDIAVYLPKKP